MLGLHEHVAADGPCMMCFFPQERSGPSGSRRGSPSSRDCRSSCSRTVSRSSPSEHLRPHCRGSASCFASTSESPSAASPARSALSAPRLGGVSPVSAVHLAAGRGARARTALRPPVCTTACPTSFNMTRSLRSRVTSASSTCRPAFDCYCRTHTDTIDAVRSVRRSY